MYPSFINFLGLLGLVLTIHPIGEDALIKRIIGLNYNKHKFMHEFNIKKF